MLIDGRAIARELKRELKNALSHTNIRPHLTVFTCEPNFETQKFLALKKRIADEVGIGINVIEFPEMITTDEVVQSINHAAIQTDGMIVQLPFPPHIKIDEVLAAIPEGYDADAAHYAGEAANVLPPVVGAIDEIAKRYGIPFAGRSVVVVGKGRLVGRPAAAWASHMGAQVSVVTRETNDLDLRVREADILILGAGRANLITPELVKDGAVIFDAGTSEANGVLVGDADPRCAEKALYMTPVPGGIGPITIIVLLRNVFLLAQTGKR
ncbi:MAG: bifunctional 5,10-methylenetetrahydrofolate dehydrogenase/5,10-methenyltetrahydrofolate cyclohydrolase [Candidatus Paceibacterota bacterium]